MGAPKKYLYHVSIVRRTATADLGLRDELIQTFQAITDGKVTWKFESMETFGYVHEAIRKLPTPSFYWYFIRETKSVGEQPKFHTNQADLEFAQSKRLSKQPNVGWEYLLSRAEQALERLEYRAPKTDPTP